MVRLEDIMIKKFIPRPLKEYARRRHQDYVLEKSVDKFSALAPEEMPSAELLSDLVYGWGNEGYSAEHEYLSALAAHARKMRAPMLECGSGLSTLLLGIAAEQNGNKVWTLEHHPEWAERMKKSLNKFSIKSVELCVAPLRKHEEFDWYDAPLEKMPRGFSMVICDGPPGATRGGRYGLIPVMREFLPAGCIILADDACRRDERAILEKWARELGAEFEISGSYKPFATMIIP